MYIHMYTYIYIYIYTHIHSSLQRLALALSSRDLMRLKIHQRGVQWKQGVVICMLLYTSLLYNTAPIHRTPLPLHPPVMNTHRLGQHATT